MYVYELETCLICRQIMTIQHYVFWTSINFLAFILSVSHILDIKVLFIGEKLKEK